MSGALFMYSDVFMLENQIPLWIVNLLMSSTYEDGHRLQLCQYLCAFVYGDRTTMSELPWDAEGGEDDPLHLLEALHRTILHNNNRSSSSYNNNNYDDKTAAETNIMWFVNSPFHSATDLRAKGVSFRPSSRCVKDIAFFSYSTHGLFDEVRMRIKEHRKVLQFHTVHHFTR